MFSEYIYKSRILSNFINDIINVNRNPEDLRALEWLKDKKTNPHFVLNENDLLYRARIVTDTKLLNTEENYYGYNSKESFVAPSNKTSDMRANYKNIPYLYASNNPYISLVEVRPRFGSQVSIATIRVKNPIEILDFTSRNIPKAMTNTKKNLFSDLSHMFSKPITRDDDVIEYIPTQFIAEYAKKLGYDGIAYGSSLVEEEYAKSLSRYNIVVFNYSECEPIKSNLFVVDSITYECIQDDSDTKPVSVQSHLSEISCF